MKKLIILLFPILTGCGCVLSQSIPPQTVYANSNCVALLPDYRPKFTITGGCTGFSVTQTPAPGYNLTATNRTVTVVVRATGTNNKSSQKSFNVSLIDTITPQIIPGPELMTERTLQINKVYDIADKMLIEMDTVFKSRLLVTTSLDSAGFRHRYIVAVDSINIPLISLKNK